MKGKLSSGLKGKHLKTRDTMPQGTNDKFMTKWDVIGFEACEVSSIQDIDLLMKGIT